MIRAARALGAVLALLGLVLGAVFAARHFEARARWAREAALLGTPDYDAAACDAASDDTVALRREAERLAAISVPGLLLLGLFGPARRAPRDAPAYLGRRAHLATLVDGAVVALPLPAASSIEAWLGADMAALGAALAVALKAASAALAWGGLAAGRSIGGGITHTSVVDGKGAAPGVGRGLVALVLWPLGLLWAPLALAFEPRSRPPHLAWTGLHRTASQSANE
ncbi:MAG: hypothetical protein R3B82_01705 [Sandaracinaceae bacterium]